MIDIKMRVVTNIDQSITTGQRIESRLRSYLPFRSNNRLQGGSSAIWNDLRIERVMNYEVG